MPNPAINRNDTADGKAVSFLRHALLAAALAGLAAAAQAQSPQPQWKKITQVPILNQDDSWGLSANNHASSRMASDPQGNLFISQGTSLYLWTAAVDQGWGAGGQTWKEVARESRRTEHFHIPLAVGGEGKVLWGDWSSKNGGASWSISPSNYFAAFAFGPKGTSLGAWSTAIYRSVNGGTEWTFVYNYLESFSNIRGLAFTPSGWAVASPDGGRLLMSRDTGATWVPLDSMPTFNGWRTSASLLTAEKGNGGESAWYITDPVQGGMVTCVELRKKNDFMVNHHPANTDFPDSAVTALQAYAVYPSQLILWLGTWGQGVFVSRDRGQTWQRSNDGLNSLYVEAIDVSSSGTVHVLAKGGLFTGSASAPASIGKRDAGLRGNGKSAGPGGAVPLFEIAGGRSFRADGRASFPKGMYLDLK
jgi:photosystem II stability/assembly factor-like uncharacterized protein